MTSFNPIYFIFFSIAFIFLLGAFCKTIGLALKEHCKPRYPPYLDALPKSEIKFEDIRVIDGDTIKARYDARWITLRLHGIDAPELEQTARVSDGGIFSRFAPPVALGKLAATELTQILEERLATAPLSHRTVTARIIERDRYGRAVALLAAPGCEDIGRELVDRGWAVAYRKYGGMRYTRYEAHARVNRLGMWAYEFIEPAQWRRGVR